MIVIGGRRKPSEKNRNQHRRAPRTGYLPPANTALGKEERLKRQKHKNQIPDRSRPKHLAKEATTRPQTPPPPRKKKGTLPETKPSPITPPLPTPLNTLHPQLHTTPLPIPKNQHPNLTILTPTRHGPIHQPRTRNRPRMPRKRPFTLPRPRIPHLHHAILAPTHQPQMIRR